MRGTVSGRTEEKRPRSARNLRRVKDVIWKTGETWLGGWRKKRRQEILVHFSRCRPRTSRKHKGIREGSARRSELKVKMVEKKVFPLCSA